MAGEDPEYIEYLRYLPCHQCGWQRGCDPHHRTGAGMGMRSHDHTAIPLCRHCHTAFHSGSGSFKKLDKQGKRDYQDSAIKKYRERYYISSKGPGP